MLWRAGSEFRMDFSPILKLELGRRYRWLRRRRGVRGTLYGARGYETFGPRRYPQRESPASRRPYTRRAASVRYADPLRVDLWARLHRRSRPHATAARSIALLP